MQSIINNRFVGTIILVIAAIILLPSILDGEKQGSPQRFKTIPKQPELQAIEQAPDFDEANIAQRFKDVDAVVEGVNPVDDTEMASATSTTTETVEQANLASTDTVQVAQVQPVTDFAKPNQEPQLSPDSSTSEQSPTSVADDRIQAQFDSQAWVIQLGAFRNEANVQSLKSKLNKAGYVVITEKIRVKSGMLTKVYVGPELDKSVLEKALPELVKLTKLTGKITKYQP